MKFVKKFTFYSHHILSIILLFFFTIIFGILGISGFYFSPKAIYLNAFSQMIGILIFFLKVIFLSIGMTYEKYLIEEKNIPFSLVGSLFGFVNLVINIIINLIFARKLNFNENYILEIILNTICYSIIYYIAYRVLYEYNTIYTEIINYIINIIKTLGGVILFSEKHYLSLFIVLESILLLICLFIYIEIIEFNCCKLNNNTRRSILIREALERMDLDSILEEEPEEPKDEKVEYPGGYLVDFNQANETKEINDKTFYNHF
jgi:hypothetical protein